MAMDFVAGGRKATPKATADPSTSLRFAQDDSVFGRMEGVRFGGGVVSQVSNSEEPEVPAHPPTHHLANKVMEKSFIINHLIDIQ
jgi:hypothetical protein